ncbi:DNA-binding response regulator [Nitrosomonas sp. HPC101]|nr:DNA-binding response regulator [Nitrosomonas sp. HPC101]
MDYKKHERLPRSHYTLLEASHEIKTTSTKILAQYLNRSPATIRTQFQRIMALLGVHSRYEALRKAEEAGLIRQNIRSAPAWEERRKKFTTSLAVNSRP